MSHTYLGTQTAEEDLALIEPCDRRAQGATFYDSARKDVRQEHLPPWQATFRSTIPQ